MISSSPNHALSVNAIWNDRSPATKKSRQNQSGGTMFKSGRDIAPALAALSLIEILGREVLTLHRGQRIVADGGLRALLQFGFMFLGS